jgi:hypothetical protein
MKKHELYQALKEDGMEFDAPYVNLKGEDLQREYDRRFKQPEQPAAAPTPPAPERAPRPTSSQASSSVPPADKGPTRKPPPVMHRDPNEVAGQRLNTLADDEPIRTDPETGRIWYQEEVTKPSFAKPRGRRVLRYNDPGVKKVTTQNGDYVEEFEVAGTESRSAEIRITLPSYQVGIYKDPRFPFKVVCYNGSEGFDFFEVNNFYGGPERVPWSVKRKYVENVLCYDIRSVIQAIEDEDRERMLAARGIPNVR